MEKRSDGLKVGHGGNGIQRRLVAGGEEASGVAGDTGRAEIPAGRENERGSRNRARDKRQTKGKQEHAGHEAARNITVRLAVMHAGLSR